MADDDHSLQHIIDQLTAILHQAEDASKQTLKGPAQPGSKEQLIMIKGMAEYFNLLNLQFLKQAGFTDEEIAKPQPPPISPQNEYERRVLDNVNRLAKNAKKRFDDLNFGLKQLKKQKSAPNARKKKFDRFGGRSKWKPL